MPRKQPTTIEECNAELELAQKSLRQYQNREKMLTRKLNVGNAASERTVFVPVAAIWKASCRG